MSVLEEPAGAPSTFEAGAARLDEVNEATMTNKVDTDGAKRRHPIGNIEGTFIESEIIIRVELWASGYAGLFNKPRLQACSNQSVYASTLRPRPRLRALLPRSQRADKEAFMLGEAK